MAEFKNLPDCLDGIWLYVGAFYNSYCFMGATICSLAVIFFAQSVVDLVFNCVATFFVLEMDDYFITDKEYKKIEKFLDSYTHRRDNKRDLPYSKAWFRFAMGFQVFTFIPTLLTFLIAGMAPFYVVVCR